MSDPIDLLKGLAYTDESADPGTDFDAMVMSRWRAEGLKRTAQYWLPGAIGAVAAALAVLAAVQWTLASPESRAFRRDKAEARLDSRSMPVIPVFTDRE